MENLKKILDLHLKWVNSKLDGVRANLRDADLYDADLYDADLSGADLRRADLRRADLRGADLRGADLRRADLRRADLSGADLSGADLYDADLRGADLRGADLRGADLRGADLPMYCKWSHSLNGDKLSIGCKTKTIKEWTKWFKSEEEYSTQRGTPDFKQIYAVFMAYKAYHKVLNDLK